jgi:hypothetical protein
MIDSHLKFVYRISLTALRFIGGIFHILVLLADGETEMANLLAIEGEKRIKKAIKDAESEP